MSDSSTPGRRLFTAYGLPLPARRQGPATLVSLLAHAAIAALVLWRGAALVAGAGGGGGPGPRGGGGGGPDRPVASWFVLPPAVQAAEPADPALPAVSVPTLAVHTSEIAPIDIPLAAIAVPAAGPGGAAGARPGPGAGGGRGGGTGPGRGAADGPGSGDDASYIVPASPRWTIIPPQGAPRDTRGRRHEVRFWVAADGRVTRVEVTPPIKDAGYRREFVERMMGYQFNPATTRDGRRVAAVASVTVIP